MELLAVIVALEMLKREKTEVVVYSEDEGETWVEIPADITVSMNMWGFTPNIFKELEESFHLFLAQPNNLQKTEFFLPEFVNNQLKTNLVHVRVIPTKERWAGVTYQKDKAIVEQYIAGLINGIWSVFFR